jgi:hypothetical protein
MVTREELHALVWSQPMTKVCERFGVSSSYMARVCTLLNVPRPPRGHWQKLAVGQAEPQEALPEALPGDQTTWNEKGGPLPTPARPRQVREPTSPRPLRRPGKPAEGTHPLIRGTIGEFRRSRPGHPQGYLRPFKKLLPDVIASAAMIERTLDVASKLFNELEAAGARVVIAPGDQRWSGMVIDEREVPKDDRQRHHYYQSSLWSPLRPTIAFFQDTAISIAVLEMTEPVLLRYVGHDKGHEGYIRETEYQTNPRKFRYDHGWTTTKDLPCGRLRIVAFSAGGVKWSKSWQEKGAATIDASLHRIARDIRAAIPEVTALVEEARRQAEIRHQEFLAAEDRRKRQEDRRRIEESTKQSQEALGQVIQQWADRMAVERFLDELSVSIDQLPESERVPLVKRLQLAREFMGTVDPLEFFRTWKTPREIYEPKFATGGELASK